MTRNVANWLKATTRHNHALEQASQNPHFWPQPPPEHQEAALVPTDLPNFHIFMYDPHRIPNVSPGTCV